MLVINARADMESVQSSAAAGLVLVWFGVCNARSVEKTSKAEPRAHGERACNMLEVDLPGGSVQGGIRVHVVESAWSGQ